MANPKVVLEAKNLTKKFGAFTAVNDVSFEAREGEILGLLGPNGAGKTTTIQMLLDVLKPTTGSIRIFDRSFARDHEFIMRRLNFSSTYVQMPGRLTVAENLYIFALLFNVAEPHRRVEEVVRLTKTEEIKNYRYSWLSSGQKTRVGLSKALINHPKLLLLDEPTASLDPDVAEEIRALLLEIVRQEKMTLLFTSHNMGEVEELCHRVIFINHGRLVAQGTPLEVTQRILSEDTDKPDLHQVFLKIVREFGD